ncbi:MAG: hypothetical protein ABJB55_02940 [Actinomycetota bacterium]
MKNPWGPFPADDLDAYERRQRLTARLVAVALAWLASLEMFMYPTVPVRDGIIALALGALVGFAAEIVVNDRRPDLPDQLISTQWPLALLLGVVAVASPCSRPPHLWVQRCSGSSAHPPSPDTSDVDTKPTSLRWPYPFLRTDPAGMDGYSSSTSMPIPAASSAPVERVQELTLESGLRIIVPWTRTRSGSRQLE